MKAKLRSGFGDISWMVLSGLKHFNNFNLI